MHQTHDNDPPPRRGYRQLWASLDSTTRYQLGLLAAETAVLGTAVGMVVPVLPSFAENIGGVGATGIGMIVAIPSLAILLFSVPSGKLADSKGRVPMMVGGSFLTAVGNVATGLSSSMIQMIPSRLTVGVGSAAATPASEAYVADVTAKFPSHRGVIMGALGGVGTLSYALGPALGGCLAEVLGPNMPFLVLGGAAGCCALALATLPETYKGGQGKGGVVSSCWESTKGLLKLRNVRGLLAMDTALYTGWAVYLGVPHPLNLKLD